MSFQSFDPQGEDGQEKEDKVRFAVDGNAGTSWETDGYFDNMGGARGIKSGVGFRLDFGQPVTPREISITFAHGPTSFQLLASNTASSDVTQYAILASGSNVNGSMTAQVKPDGAHQFWVVWLTSLPRVGSDYRGTVVDVALHA